MKHFCIIGYPVKHSKSPIIHTTWYKEYHVNADYVTQEVASEDLAAFMKSFKSNFSGCNVTIPHKIEIAKSCDVIDDAAKAIGAINMLYVENNKIHATNTDYIGYLLSVDEAVPGWDKEVKSALVLGAGGGARGILYGLKERGIKNVSVANRTISKAQTLLQEFGMAGKAITLDDAMKTLAGYDMVINTTSLGLNGNNPLILPLETLPKTAILSDIVYNPLITHFLAEGEKLGLRTVHGLGMLLHQAVPCFEKWTGRRPMVTKALEATIKATMGK